MRLGIHKIWWSESRQVSILLTRTFGLRAAVAGSTVRGMSTNNPTKPRFYVHSKHKGSDTYDEINKEIEAKVTWCHDDPELRTVRQWTIKYLGDDKTHDVAADKVFYRFGDGEMKPLGRSFPPTLPG